MTFFKKKTTEKPSSQVTITQEKKHEHKFQDFPWYIETNKRYGPYQSQNCLKFKIIEPYVCIYCGERKDVILSERELTGIHKKDMDEIIEEVKEKYSDRIMDRPLIEDMINDLKLVDVGHLKWYHFLAGTKDPSTSRNSDINIPDSIKLKL